MTDLEKFIALMLEFGIPKDDLGIEIRYERQILNLSDNGWRINTLGKSYEETKRLEEASKIKGYCGFFVAVEFDMDGKFICIGAWE